MYAIRSYYGDRTGRWPARSRRNSQPAPVRLRRGRGRTPVAPRPGQAGTAITGRSPIARARAVAGRAAAPVLQISHGSAMRSGSVETVLYP